MHFYERHGFMNSETNKKRTRLSIKLPRTVLIVICAIPIVLTILFYSLRSVTIVMSWASNNFSAPVRGFLGMLSSIYPLSVMEVLCTAAVLWLIYYLARTVAVTVHRREKMKILTKRLLPVIVAAVYLWCLFCWVWSSGYHAPGFAERNGFSSGGVAAQDLVAVTRMFANKANELSTLVKRDEDGRYVGDRREILDSATSVYQNIVAEFPDLDGKLYKPKSMMYSWLMSRTGYTGIYFALTGESNINSRAPVFLIPVTAAHELAHQRGVFAEDEANFVGIAASVTSGNTAYEYAGYLLGLLYLLPALSGEDSETYYEIGSSLTEEVNRDWQENSDYWQSQRRVETGVELIDNVLSVVVETMNDSVDAVYDGYLKSQKQELGIKSYGACIDLLVEYFK